MADVLGAPKRADARRCLVPAQDVGSVCFQLLCLIRSFRRVAVRLGLFAAPTAARAEDLARDVTSQLFSRSPANTSMSLPVLLRWPCPHNGQYRASLHCRPEVHRLTSRRLRSFATWSPPRARAIQKQISTSATSRITVGQSHASLSLFLTCLCSHRYLWPECNLSASRVPQPLARPCPIPEHPSWRPLDHFRVSR